MCKYRSLCQWKVKLKIEELKKSSASIYSPMRKVSHHFVPEKKSLVFKIRYGSDNGNANHFDPVYLTIHDNHIKSVNIEIKIFVSKKEIQLKTTKVSMQ